MEKEMMSNVSFKNSVCYEKKKVRHYFNQGIEKSKTILL